jgi:hypothetical protein
MAASAVLIQALCVFDTGGAQIRIAEVKILF